MRADQHRVRALFDIRNRADVARLAEPAGEKLAGLRERLAFELAVGEIARVPYSSCRRGQIGELFERERLDHAAIGRGTRHSTHDKHPIGADLECPLDVLVALMNALGEQRLFRQGPRSSQCLEGAAPSRIGMDRYDIAHLLGNAEE